MEKYQKKRFQAKLKSKPTHSRLSLCFLFFPTISPVFWHYYNNKKLIHKAIRTNMLLIKKKEKQNELK
jgi:hypothetical protein